MSTMTGESYPAAGGVGRTRSYAQPEKLCEAGEKQHGEPKAERAVIGSLRTSE